MESDSRPPSSLPELARASLEAARLYHAVSQPETRPIIPAGCDLATLARLLKKWEDSVDIARQNAEDAETKYERARQAQLRQIGTP